MGRSSKIRHRRRRRACWTRSEIRQIHQRASELAPFFEAPVQTVEEAVAQALGELIRPKDSYVLVDPCALLPGLEGKG